MTYAVQDTPGVFVDHEALHNLLNACNRADARVALVGFGEYAKHLINLAPGKIVAVYDPSPLIYGVRFRDVPVVSLTESVDCNLILGCEYKLLYDFMGSVVKKHPHTAHYYPPRLHYINTSEINPFEQEAIYKAIFRDADQAPVSMMNMEKIKLLIEFLRMGLTFPGNVLESGSWQGGSTWFIAKALQYLGEQRKLFAMDLFELHDVAPTATVCTDEVRQRLAFYPNTVCIEGLVDDPACLAQVDDGPLCFAHVDLGCIDRSMAFIWERLSPGAPMLLDNYGHLAATWDYETFFEGLGVHIVRFPWSEQGLVFKR